MPTIPTSLAEAREKLNPRYPVSLVNSQALHDRVPHLPVMSEVVDGVSRSFIVVGASGLGREVGIFGLPLLVRSDPYDDEHLVEISHSTPSSRYDLATLDLPKIIKVIVGGRLDKFNHSLDTEFLVAARSPIKAFHLVRPESAGLWQLSIFDTQGQLVEAQNPSITARISDALITYAIGRN
jgi:hypothetical protein